MRWTLQKTVALLLGILLPVLGLADAGLAQSAVSVQGTIQSVNCQTQSLVLQSASGSNTLSATPATAVVVNSAGVPFCVLQQYVGDSATAWLVPSGNEFQVTRIDVTGPATSAAAPAVSSPSPLGLILGALAVGALGYVIGRSSAPQPVYQPYAPGYQWSGQGNPRYAPGYQWSGQGNRRYAPGYQPYAPGYQPHYNSQGQSCPDAGCWSNDDGHANH